MPRCLPIMTSFFDRFFIDFWSQLRPPEPSKSLFFIRKNNICSKHRLSKLRSIFDAILVPTWLHFALRNPPKSFKKSDPKSHQNFDRFLLRFFLDSGSVLGTKLELCWPPFSSQDAPRRLKDSHKTPQDAPKTPKDAPRRPKTPPRRPQGAQNPPQTTILEGFLEDFFGRFCCPTCLLKLTFEKSLPPQIRFPKKPI